MSIVFDILLVLLLIASIVVGYQKGLIKTVWKIAALIITIVLVMLLRDPAINYLSGSGMAQDINTKISENVSVPTGGGVDIADNLNLPEFMKGEVNNQIKNTQGVITSVNETVTSSLTSFTVAVIACVLLFIIIRLLLMVAYIILSGVTKLPVIRGVNKLVGSLLGLINMIFMIFLLLSCVSLFAPADSELFEILNNTYLVKYFYNYNILLKLFMKI